VAAFAAQKQAVDRTELVEYRVTYCSAKLSTRTFASLT